MRDRNWMKQGALNLMLKRGLVLCCLMGSFGCSMLGATPPIVVTKVERLAPPADLVLETPEPTPPVKGGTNATLYQYAKDLLAALRSANADKAALREWALQ